MLLAAYGDDIDIVGLSVKEVTNTFMNIDREKGRLAVKSEKI